MTGALIGSLITTPWLALPLAFGAHFALDSLPHINYPAEVPDPKFFIYLAIDMALAASILLSVCLLQPHNWLILVASGVICASPDLMWLKYQIIDPSRGIEPQLGPLARFHDRIQKIVGSSWPYVTVELSWFLVMGAVFFWRLPR
jgi:hypothetical protein